MSTREHDYIDNTMPEKEKLFRNRRARVQGLYVADDDDEQKEKNRFYNCHSHKIMVSMHALSFFFFLNNYITSKQLTQDQ